MKRVFFIASIILLFATSTLLAKPVKHVSFNIEVGAGFMRGSFDREGSPLGFRSLWKMKHDLDGYGISIRPEVKVGQFIFGAELGSGDIDPTDHDATYYDQDTTGVVSDLAVSSSSGNYSYWDLFVAWRLLLGKESSYLDLGLGYHNYESSVSLEDPTYLTVNYQQVNNSETGKYLDYDFQVYGVKVLSRARFDIAQGFFVKGEIAYLPSLTMEYSETYADSRGKNKVDGTGYGFQAGLGIGYQPTKVFGIMAEYRHSEYNTDGEGKTGYYGAGADEEINQSTDGLFLNFALYF